MNIFTWIWIFIWFIFIFIFQQLTNQRKPWKSMAGAWISIDFSSKSSRNQIFMNINIHEYLFILYSYSHSQAWNNALRISILQQKASEASPLARSAFAPQAKIWVSNRLEHDFHQRKYLRMHAQRRRRRGSSDILAPKVKKSTRFSAAGGALGAFRRLGKYLKYQNT